MPRIIAIGVGLIIIKIGEIILMTMGEGVDSTITPVIGLDSSRYPGVPVRTLQ
jgi:hypothetical protein